MNETLPVDQDGLAVLCDLCGRYTRLPDTVVAALRQLGMRQHRDHSNVGETERLKEWSTCQYTFCKSTYDLAYGVPKGE